MDNRTRRPANICRYIYMLQRYEKPRTKQNHNAAKINAPQRGCSVYTAAPRIWTTWTIWTTPPPSIRPPPNMDKYRQRGKRPDVWRREDRPRAVRLPVCSVCPLRRYIVRPAAYRAAGGKHPDVWRRGGRPVLFFCRVCSVRPFV